MNTDQQRLYNTLREELEYVNNLNNSEEKRQCYSFGDKKITLPQILQEIEAETDTGKNIVKELEEKGRRGLYDMVRRGTHIQQDFEPELLSVPFKDFSETLIKRMQAPHAPSGFYVPVTSKVYTWEGALRQATEGQCNEIFTMMYIGTLSKYEAL